jgi:polyisoprenoid-binding protein YceI
VDDGTYGPHNATLTVRTARSGAAAKAGHDLLIEVTQWEATVADGAVTVTADPRSLKVREGTGGVMPLGADDYRNIEQTIDDEVLQGRPIEYRDGQLTLNGQTHPIAVEVTDTGGRATIRQSVWGMKPYSALFGTLKVADEVIVDARLG